MTSRGYQDWDPGLKVSNCGWWLLIHSRYVVVMWWLDYAIILGWQVKPPPVSGFRNWAIERQLVLVGFQGSVVIITKQTGDEPALGLTLGQLGQLPRLELVGVDQDCGDAHQQTVPHVQHADHLIIRRSKKCLHMLRSDHRELAKS